MMQRTVVAIALGVALGGCQAKICSNVRATNDFALHQRNPDLPEDRVCGAITSRIHRRDKAFHWLVQNENAEIVYKDEEKTGADRFMTKRLSRCIDRLAARVANEWQGVRLRVTEAWDEDGEHREGSLHYDGRAADVTTSDRDRSKNGRLARLAVESGFDFVWFEDALHVHVSVQREDVAQ